MHERHERILHLVADGYVRTAKPVPSAKVAAHLDVSSATVRNAFSALEDEGLLQQPHTSAGRIPTELGFRRYAHVFLPPQPLPAAALEALERRLNGLQGEALLQQIAQAAAELSGYAVVVSLPADDRLLAMEIHLSALHARALMAVVVLENGLVRQLRVDLDPSPDEEVLDDAERQLRQLTLPIGEVPKALAVLAEHAEPEMARTLHALRRAWPSVVPTQTAMAGLGGLLHEPEAADPGFLRLAVEQVERPAGAVAAPAAQPGQVAEEPMLLWQDGLVTVRAHWRIGGGAGELRLVGPARLRYGSALQVVHGVTSTAGRVGSDA